MKTILNVVNGVEVECYDETVGQVARVVIRNSAGHRVVTIMAITTQDGYVSFNQQSLESVSESHVFTVLPGQQFCGAKLSDSFMCCLPSNHKIHTAASGERRDNSPAAIDDIFNRCRIALRRMPAPHQSAHQYTQLATRQVDWAKW